MSKIIISGTRGTDDPNMATLPFLVAKSAQEQGHEVILWLWNESVVLAKKGIADHIVAVNLPPLKDILTSVQKAGIPIWVCESCAVGRGISNTELVAGAAMKGAPDYISALLASDKSMMF